MRSILLVATISLSCSGGSSTKPSRDASPRDLPPPWTAPETGTRNNLDPTWRGEVTVRDKGQRVLMRYELAVDADAGGALRFPLPVGVGSATSTLGTFASTPRSELVVDGPAAALSTAKIDPTSGRIDLFRKDLNFDVQIESPGHRGTVQLKGVLDGHRLLMPAMGAVGRVSIVV